jgi:hypothetical protein
MKTYWKRYAYAFAITAPIAFVLAAGIMRRYDAVIPLRSVFLGSVLISMLIALSITVFKTTWGNGVPNIIIGYLIIFPIPILIRLMFGVFLFRTTLALYGFGLIYTVVYSFVVLYASLSNRKTKEALNALLKDKKDD